MKFLAAAAFLVACPALAGDPEGAEDTCPLKVGTPVPQVMLKDIHGKPFDMRAQVRRAPTLFVFFRGGWCPFCNLHLSELAKLQPELKQLGVEVVAISPDRPEELKNAASKNALAHTLVSDSDAAAMRAFGLAYRVDEETFGKLKGHAMDIEAASGRTHRLLPVPAVYLAGTDGVVRFAYANPNYRERVPGAVVLAAARHLVQTKRTPAPATKQ